MPNRGLTLVVCLGLSSAAAAWGQQYTITTLAGNGSAGFNDGSDPTQVQFNNPNAIAIDSKGVLYLADTANYRIRTITNGTTATIAGTGTAGSSGNGAAATSATLSLPGGVAVDSSGNVYVSDTGNSVVRKISGGNINIFAGSGTAGYSGDGGQAAVAGLTGPTGLAIDSAGNVYIADTGDSLIRKVDKNGIITSYIGGTGPTAGRLNHPTGIWLDAAGALYVADSSNRRIIKYAGSTFTVIAGNGTAGFSGDGGPASKALLNNPTGVAVDAAGSIYIADSNNGRIRKITPDGNIVTIAGRGGSGYYGDGGPATAAGLAFPRSLTIDSSGNVYVADTQNSVIRLLSPAYPTVGGVSNAASGATRISPGALASVYGSNFGSTTTQPSAPLPAFVGGVSVFVNGTAAPVYYLSPAQINFQVPWGTATGTGNITVAVNGGSSNTVSLPVSAAAPGLFYLPSGAAIVQNQDYSVNDPSNPAARGSTIIAYLTGSGPVSPAQTDGVPAQTSGLVQMTSSYSATIGSAAAQVTFAGLSPGFIGLVQMNIVVPQSLTPGVYPLSVTIGNDTSNSATIAVK
ncbi:MAG TPA: IPT/TIG domain-containing protein [Candidatus Acidoferrales bacterium]|nr:IPT/TIG domain-containing protein [Candidatus Acidoferrales bacterium]